MTATNSRQCLQQIRPMATTHPGMWLDRYLQNHDAKSALIKEVAAIETHAKSALIKEVAAIETPEVYRHHKKGECSRPAKHRLRR